MTERDEQREDRIKMEIVVDAYTRDTVVHKFLP